MGLTTDVVGASRSITGKHKIPRYLYHITPTRNIQSIKKTGLNMTEDELFGEGIFLFDMANFTKFWTKQNKNVNFALELLKSIFRRSTDITMLKIPVENLAKDKLVIRRPEKLFYAGYKYKDVSSIFRAYERQEIPMSLMDELTIGIPAVRSNKFDRKKIPVEYIYSDDIPAKDLQILGQAKGGYTYINIRKIFEDLLKNCKESAFLSKFL